jgi:hypothetical protein
MNRDEGSEEVKEFVSPFSFFFLHPKNPYGTFLVFLPPT